MTLMSYVYYGLIGLFVLIIIIYFGNFFINSIQTYSSQSSWIVNGTQLARSPKMISGSMIPPSNSGRYGIEFTYLTWIYVNDIIKANENHYQPIFIKGSTSTSDDGLPFLASPGILLGKNGNEITIVMNVLRRNQPVMFDSDTKPVEYVTIDNIPMGKWFQLGVVLMNNKMDVYINGQIKTRKEFDGIPDINMSDLHVASNNGFDGFISNAIYYASAVPYYKIDQHFRVGPSQKPCDITGARPPYLAPNYWTT